MKFLPRPRPGGTVIILGAGASFGANVEKAPPVMNMFVRAGRNIVKNKYDSLWSFLERIGYSLASLENGTPNLEELFTTLQTISTGIWYTSRADYAQSVGEEFARIRPIDLLLSFIIETLDIPSVSACKKPCMYHRKLFRQLRPGDTVISFNYDLIAEAALRKEVRWDEAGGYGFSCLNRIKELNSKGGFDTARPCDVALLKPHGSLNWRLEEYRLPVLGNSPIQNFLRPIREELLGSRPRRQDDESIKRISLISLDNIKDHCYSHLSIEELKLQKKLLKLMTPEGRRIFLRGGVAIYDDAFIIPPAAYKFTDSDMPSARVIHEGKERSHSIASKC
jgi:hypothetical protein